MLLDPAIIAFCMQFQNSGNNGCKIALDQTSSITQTTTVLNELQSYSTQFIYKNVDKNIIKGLISSAFLINAYKNRTVTAQFPLKTFEFNFNISGLSQQYGLKFKYDF